MNKRFFKSEFYKDVFTLLSGTTLAQAVPIAISPILTRLYSPEDFGLFALYFGFCAFLAVFPSGRYDLSIIEPRQDKEAKTLVLTSLLLTTIFCIFLGIIIILFNSQIARLLGNSEIHYWLYISPISVFAISCISISYHWLNRKKKYKSMSVGRVINSSTNSFTSLVLLNKLFNGLILGSILGQLTSLIYLKDKVPHKISHFKWKNAKVLMSKYSDYPKYLMPATFAGQTAVSGSLILLTSFFGASIVGFFSVTNRVTEAPIVLIGNAIGEVYRQKASLEYQEMGNCRVFYLKTLKKLLLLAIIPFIILFFFSEMIFGFVFGEDWVIAGTIAKYLSFSVLFNFLSTPLSYTIVFNKSQQLDMFLQIFRAIFSITAIYIGCLYSDYMISIKLYALVYSIYYICHSFIQYRSACGYPKLKFF